MSSPLDQIKPQVARGVFLEMYRAVERRKRSMEAAETYRGSFRKFVPVAWPSVEPSHGFTPAWHIDAIADHLQAVADGQIQNLLINISPGSAKSLLCCVMFPAWKWSYHPEWRSTFASYDSGLSARDSVRCRDLIESVWYQETFQPTWKFAPDQNEKTYYVNSAKGFRVSTSVTGRGTGWRSDAIVCLFGDTKITTDRGDIEVQRIVDERLDVRVLAFDHEAKTSRWQRIEDYEDGPGRPSLTLSLSDGTRIQCTEDHPVFVVGTGYVKAKDVKSGDQLINASRSMLSMRKGVQSVPEGYPSLQGRPVQSRVPKGMAVKAAGSETHHSPSFGLRALQQDIPGWRERKEQGRAPVLQPAMRRSVAIGSESRDVRQPSYGSVRGVREGNPANQALANRTAQEVFPCVLRQDEIAAGFRERESKLCGRSFAGGLRPGIPFQDRASYSAAGPLYMPRVREDARAGDGSSGCSPHRLRKKTQLPDQPDLTLPQLPLAGAWGAGAAGASEAVFVCSIEPAETPSRVFNLRVHQDHNYFANGILLHNCDDPLNVNDQFSDAVLERCILWWTNTMHNRLISMERGARVIIMQRVGDRDLSAHVLKTGGWEHLMIPMEYDPSRSKVTKIGWKDPRAESGDLMCPKIFSAAVIEETKRTLGASAYAGQYQQSPAPAGGGILKSYKWNYWQPTGMNLPPVRVKMANGEIQERTAVELPTDFDVELQGWDFAFKDLETSDYVAGMAVAVRGANRYIRDQAHARMDITASIQAVRELTRANPRTHLKLVEAKANGPAVVQILNQEITGLVLVEPQGGKVARAVAASPELEAGNWFLPHPLIAPWVGNPENPTEGGFLAETVLFPFGAHDDWVDVWSMIGVRLQKEKIGGEFGLSDKEIRVDPFEIEPKWPRVYGLSVNWREIGAVWIARRPETDQHYAYAEFFAPAGDPVELAKEIKRIGGYRWTGEYVPGVIHPTEQGRDEKDGYALVNRYSNLGLRLTSIPDNYDAELTDIQEAFHSGKLRAFGALAKFFDQFIMYRRDDKGKLPTHNVALVKALLVAWRGRQQMRGPGDPSKAHNGLSPVSTGKGWMVG